MMMILYGVELSQRSRFINIFDDAPNIFLKSPQIPFVFMSNFFTL